MSSREVITCLNPERIQWCCDQVHIDLRRLSDATKIPEEKLGRATLTENQLRKVAEYFGHSIFFFAEAGSPDKNVIHSAQFRSLGKQVDLNQNLYKIIRRVEQHRDLFIDLLEDAGEAPVFQPPDFSGSTAGMADSVRQWLQMDPKCVKDAKDKYRYYRRLIQDKGIFVLQSLNYKGMWKVRNPEKMLGFSINHQKLPTIFITKTSSSRQTFTLFHELGHLLLHGGSFLDESANFRSNASSEKEVEANDFARQCLLPDDILEELEVPADHCKYHEFFRDISDELGISVEVILVALLKTCRIKQSAYKAYKKLQEENYEKSKKGEKQDSLQKVPRAWRHREPLHIFGPRYVDTVLGAMQQGELTLHKASRCLDGIKATDIKKLLDQNLNDG